MGLQLVGDLHELLIALRQILLQLGDRLRSTDTCYHVFALRIDQIFSVNALGAGGRVAGESNAGAGGIAHIAEYHGLHVDSGSPIARNIIHPAVYDGARIVPGTEYCFYGLHQLILGILREIGTDFFFVQLFIFCDDFFQVIGIQISVILRPLGLLNLVQNRLKFRFCDLHHNVRKHLDKTAIGIISETGISSLLREAFHRHVVQTQVQDRIHHTRHGSACAGTDRNQQRILRVTKTLTLDFLQSFHIIENLSLDFLRDLLSIVVIIRTSFGRHRKALRYRKAQIGHFGQVGTFSAKKIAHVRVTFFEQIHPFCHFLISSYICSLRPPGKRGEKSSVRGREHAYFQRFPQTQLTL